MNVNEIIMYLRKSRKDYEFSNEEIEKTLERHEKILQNFATATYGHKIPEENIFREVVSGDTISDRPEMQKVMSLIEDPKYKAVLVLEIERLARGNTIDQGLIAQTFEYTNTLIITPQKIFNLNDDMDRSFFEDGLYQSRKYLLYTKKILTRGRVTSVREGKYIGSSTPFGYDKEKLKNTKGYKLVINEEEAKIVKIIFNMYIDGDGAQKIANHLNRIGAKPRKNDVWTSAMVRNILTRPAVNGKVTWNNRKTVSIVENGAVKKVRPKQNKEAIIVDGLHDAIIDDETWNKALARRKINFRSKPVSDIKNSLSGLIKCKICGRNMVRRPYNSGRVETLMCPLPGCQNVASDLNVVEKKLLTELEKIVCSFESNYMGETEQNNHVNYDVIIQNIEHNITTINKQLDKVYNLFENGLYDQEEFSKRRNDLKEDIKIKELYIKELRIKQDEENKRDYSSKIPVIRNILSIYDDLDIKMKNELLKGIIDRVYYYKQKSGRWEKDNIDKFVLEIVLKI